MAESFVVRGDNHPPKIHLFTGEGFVTYKYANGKMAYITQISLVQMVLNSTKEVQLEVLASLIQDLTPPEIREIRDLTGTA
jgi:hypothetical protein